MVESRADGVTIGTNHGPTVSARHAIFATGYEMLKGIPTKGHRITSTWALATRPQPRATWADKVLISEASSPYLYMRVGPRGRIICGGEDESGIDDEARDALTPTKINQIEAKLGRLLPGIDPRADYAWSGSFGASRTGSPSIGAVPGKKNCYAVLGYGGNGITFSMMAAQLLSTTLGGGSDPDADLFSFRRNFDIVTALFSKLAGLVSEIYLRDLVAIVLLWVNAKQQFEACNQARGVGPNLRAFRIKSQENQFRIVLALEPGCNEAIP